MAGVLYEYDVFPVDAVFLVAMREFALPVVIHVAEPAVVAAQVPAVFHHREHGAVVLECRSERVIVGFHKSLWFNG
jgi:hypothetical protein